MIMIEMNLMDSPSYIVGNYSSGDEKKSAGIFILIAIIVLIPLASIFMVKSIFDAAAEKEKAKNSVHKEIEAVRARAKSETAIEEIVDSVSVVAPKPIFNKNYENMAKWEQMDYEVKFNAFALEEFSKTIPGEITFNEIRIFNYKTVIAEGTAPNKASVTRLFSGLKSVGWELQPQPRSNIRDGGSFYYFHIEADYYLSTTALLENPVKPENKPNLARLSEVKDKINRSARTYQLKTKGLNLVKSVNEPNEKVYTYSIKFEVGLSEFKHILNFIKAVSVMPEPIRCESITLKYKPKTIEGTVIIAITLR
ncbi:MAG: hypothetical protein FWF51_03505 [Chitinivibrionia bacterium]|nr:hypothetical protein [Chitinivibrionia bacterium]